MHSTHRAPLGSKTFTWINYLFSYFLNISSWSMKTIPGLSTGHKKSHSRMFDMVPVLSMISLVCQATGTGHNKSQKRSSQSFLSSCKFDGNQFEHQPLESTMLLQNNQAPSKALKIGEIVLIGILSNGFNLKISSDLVILFQKDHWGIKKGFTLFDFSTSSTQSTYLSHAFGLSHKLVQMISVKFEIHV